MMASIRTTQSPPAALVFAHFGLAGVFLVLACGAALAGAGDFAGYYAQPRLLAVTHLLVLGWINLCAFGVLLQMVPVIFHAPLRWPWLAWVHLGVYVGGAAGLAATFWIGRLDTPLVIAGGLAWSGVVLLAVNLGGTLASSRPRDVSAWIIAGALVNLLLTATLGAALTINFTHPFLARVHLDYLKLHAHLGFAGWLLCLIMGAGRRLLPMFLLAPEPPPGRTLVAFGFVQAGLALWAGGLFLTAAGRGWIPPAAAALLAAGVGVWLFEVRAIFRSRARRALDPALKTAGVALGGLGLAAALGLTVGLLREPPGEAVLVYGALVLLAAVSLLVQALLYKIVPFLVWLHRWSPLVGRQPVPTLRELAARAWMRLQLALFAAGVVLLVAGMLAGLTPLVRAGAGVLLTSAVLLAVNFLRIGLAANPGAEPAGAPAPAQPLPVSLP